jgi:hypothetical protein
LFLVAPIRQFLLLIAFFLSNYKELYTIITMLFCVINRLEEIKRVRFSKTDRLEH